MQLTHGGLKAKQKASFFVPEENGLSKSQMFLAWLFTLAMMGCIIAASINRRPPNFLEAASSPSLPGMSAMSGILSVQNVEPYADSIWDAARPSERDAVIRLLNESHYLEDIHRQIVRALNDGNGYAAMALVRRTYHVKQRVAQIAVNLMAQRNGIYIASQREPSSQAGTFYMPSNY